MKNLSLSIFPFPGKHTAVRISQMLDTIVEKTLGVTSLTEAGWGPTVTSDCGSNIGRALDVENKYTFWMKCCLHIIHNVVTTALKDPIFNSNTTIMQRSQKLIAHLARTSVGMDKFWELQEGVIRE